MTTIDRRIGKSLLAIVAAITISNTSFAQVTTHDLISAGTDQYRVSGNDPYIVFNAQGPEQNASHLIFDLGSDLKGVPLELFFMAKGELFDPYFKVSFTATKFPSALALPENIKLTPSTRLRLDITACAECLISTKNLPILAHSPANAIAEVELTNVQNGVSILTNQPRAMSTQGWRLNDLSGDLTHFEITGSDPFLVSPKLTTSTSNLAGVYFKLIAPSSDEVSNDYQLFYQTERHPFSISAHSTLRIISASSQTVEFIAPLDFLSSEQPSDLVLERLRLDIPNIAGKWALIEARLVHQDQSTDAKSLIPQHVQIKQQRASGLALAKKSIINVASDTSFLISYILLLLLICALFLRAYRSSQ